MTESLIGKEKEDSLNITLPRHQIREACQGFSKVISGKTTIPVLGCVRFEAGSGKCRAQVTDLDQVVQFRFADAEVFRDGACIIPFTALKDVTKGAKNEHVEVYADASDDVQLVNHVGGHAVSQPIAGMDLDEWPAIDTSVTTKPADEMIQAYKRLIPFSSTDETRWVLNSVFVEGGKGEKPVTMVATDGRRLACFNSMALPLKKSIVVPRSKFLSWPKLPGDVEIGIREDNDLTWLGVKAGSFTYAVKCVSGTYPNYRQVIPAEPGENVITLADSDVDLLKQVLPTFPGGEDLTVVGNNGKVTLYGCGPDDDRWTTLTLDQTTYKGERKFIGINRYFLLDALDAGFLEFAINDEFSPLLSRDGKGGTHVLMPMRVQDPVDTEEAEETVHPAADTAGVVPDQPVEQPVVEKHDAEPEPVAKKPTTRRKKMPKVNEQKNDTPALDRVLAACDAAKTKVKEAGQALTELGAAIRDAAREQKTQSKEIDSARAALAKLQAISL